MYEQDEKSFGGDKREVKRKLGAQLHLKPDYDREDHVVDYDDLWVKTPEKFPSTPGVYVRGEQENEIDALWAGLKDTNVPKTSPAIYLGIGFGSGLLVAFIISTILFWGTAPKVETPVDISSIEQPIIKQTQSEITVPNDIVNPNKDNQKEYKDLVSYTIQNGDTLGSIAERFYKSSSPKYVQLIQRANNLKSAHTISAGKKLLIPVKE